LDYTLRCESQRTL